MRYMGIGDKVIYMLNLAKSGNAKREDIEILKEFAKENSNDVILGKVNGYSISDYAIVTLYWLGQFELYKEFIKDIDINEKWCIENLIKSEIYKSI